MKPHTRLEELIQLFDLSNLNLKYLRCRLTPELPLYDERFKGYGMNKISHVMELSLLGQVS